MTRRAIVWFGVLGAPVAWVGMFLLSFGSYLASCAPAGSHWRIPVEGWTLAATVTGGVVAVLAELAAFITYRATRGADSEPPAGRVHFLAVIGLAVGPLFLAIILLSGLGAISLPACREA